MSKAPPAVGAALERWFDRLDGQGFRIGVRERLLVQSLLARLAAAGELPAELHGTLALAAPLLCTSPAQQRHYAALLADFVAAAPAAAAAAAAADSRRSADVAPPRWGSRTAMAAFAAALVLLVAARLHAPPAPPGAPAQADLPAEPAPAPAPAAVAPPFYVPPLPLPLQPPLAPAWSAPARAGLLTLGALSTLALLGAALAGRRRQLALQGLRTGEEVEHHLLHDAAPVDIAPHPVLARAVGRALRQRVAGEALLLDTAATLRATVAAQGAFTPRWRELQRTPEYLALVDTRHPADHHAAYAHALLDALARAGVALQVCGYDGSPAAGCWLRGALGNDDAATRQHLPLATLLTRAGRGRLLVFGPAEPLLQPATGELQPWAAALRALAERAWFTPVPMHAWGAAEQAASGAGFLVLPLQEAALPTLAGWLTSRRLTLALDTDTPQSLPALLHGAALDWVTHSDAPPLDTVATLLRQLRRMLGGLRMQWLCACAVFPALTPPLTLALGRRLVADPRALALGLAALSALPWFRYGRMPAWLRRELLRQLAPDLRRTLQAEVQQRLDSALDAGAGPALADIATRKRRLLAALGQRHGPLQDVVLADFVRPDVEPDLVQKLPQGLRRRLFVGGDPARGIRPAALALPATLCVAAAVAATPLWPLLVGTRPQPALALAVEVSGQLDPAAVRRRQPLQALGESEIIGPSGVVDLSPPARLLVATATQLPSLPALAIPLATVAADGTRLDLSGGRLQLRDAGGAALGAPLDTSGSPPLAAAFTPSGSRVVAVLADGRTRGWGRPWPVARADVVDCADADPDSGRAGDLARLAAGFSDQLQLTAYSATSWAAAYPTPQAPPPLGAVAIRDAASRPLAQSLADMLGRQVAWSPPSGWTLRVVATLPQAVTLGVCPLPGAAPADPAANPAGGADWPAIPGLDAASNSALQQRVGAIFAADAGTRKTATTALLQDRDRLSDAVPLLVWRATRIQASRLAGSEGAQAGIIDALTLLQAAPPASLNRDRAGIVLLLDDLRGNGPQTADQATLLTRRMDAVDGLRPVIPIQIASELQRPLAERLAQRLKAAGLAPAGIELVGERAPLTIEVRVQGYSDRRIARSLRDAARSVLGQPVTLVALRPTPANDTYEIWFNRDLCTTRQLAGCMAMQPAAAASSAAAAPAAALPAGNAAAPLGASYPNAATLDLVARFEGFQANVYKTASGALAIGYGHLLAADEEKTWQLRALPKVDIRNGITQAQAREVLAADLLPFYGALNGMVTVPLTANQRGALASLIYNVGPQSLRDSLLLKLLNRGDYNAVVDAIARWPDDGSKPPPGLQARRKAEALQFSADLPAVAAAPASH